MRGILLTIGYVASIALAAQLYVYLPGNPVPITAQTFVVLAGAIVLGSTRATVGAAVYLGLGVTGVPLFAASNGATVGYIVGFVVAGALLGAAAQRGRLRGPVQVASAMVVGNLIIYGLGVAWIVATLHRGGRPPVDVRGAVPARRRDQDCGRDRARARRVASRV